MFKNKSNLNFGQVVKEDMLLKDTSIFNSCSLFVQRRRTICVILVEGITSNISVILF